MRAQSGPSRRPAREFTRIALVLLVLAGCSSCPPRGLPGSTPLERQGELALQQGCAAEARAIFFQAMRGQDCPFLAWIGVARSSIALGDLKTADIALSQAMQINPGTGASMDLVAKTMLMIAQAMGTQGRAQALLADALFRQAERLDPNLPKLAYHRGLANLAANDPGVATPLLEIAVSSDPNDEDALRALLLAYERTGRAERGRDLIEALRQQNRLPSSMASWGAIEAPGASSREAVP